MPQGGPKVTIVTHFWGSSGRSWAPVAVSVLTTPMVFCHFERSIFHRFWSHLGVHFWQQVGDTRSPFLGPFLGKCPYYVHETIHFSENYALAYIIQHIFTLFRKFLTSEAGPQGIPPGSPGDPKGHPKGHPSQLV